MLKQYYNQDKNLTYLIILLIMRKSEFIKTNIEININKLNINTKNFKK